jgi:hypothetical protein
VCIDALFNEGNWSNTSLREISLFQKKKKKFIYIELMDCVEKFINLNTPITSLCIGGMNFEFKRILNENIRHLHPCQFPLTKSFLERNRQSFEIRRFQTKRISQLNCFNVFFKFKTFNKQK